MKTRTSRWMIVALAALGGCVTYSGDELARLSPVELCELQIQQGVNLDADTRRTLRTELERRKVDCAGHAVELALRRDARMHELTYGLHDDP
jgi:hypothetical protein